MRELTGLSICASARASVQATLRAFSGGGRLMCEERPPLDQHKRRKGQKKGPVGSLAAHGLADVVVVVSVARWYGS